MGSETVALWGVLVGGAIGVVGTLAATALKHYLETRRAEFAR